MAGPRGAGHETNAVKPVQADRARAPRRRKAPSPPPAGRDLSIAPAAEMGAQTGGGFTLADWWLVLAVVVVTGLIYANVFQNQFLFDDLQTIVELQQREGGQGALTDVLALLHGRPAYRPIRTASYAFDYALSGLDPWGYHLANTAYHALAAVAVYLIARGLFGGTPSALLAALLFAVHPVQTDAVTYMSGRRDILSGLFVLAGFYAFMRYRATGRLGYLATMLPLYLLAFFSKESGIILPVLCVAYDVLRHLRKGAAGEPVKPWSASWAIPFTDICAAIAGAVSEARWLYLSGVALGGGFAAYVLLLVRGTWQQAYHGGSLWFTLLTMARVVRHYLTLMVWPLTLNADYSYNAFPVTTSSGDLQAWLAVLLLAVLWYGILATARIRPIAAFGGAWFFLALLPVSQIVPHHEMMAEHFLYVPIVGFALAVAGLLDPYLSDVYRRRTLYPVCLIVLALLSVRTVWRNADWRDQLTLWGKTVEVAPESARARNNLAGAYLQLHQLTAAEEQLKAALRIRPDFAPARANLGKLHLDRGDLDSAEQELRAALADSKEDAIPRLWLGVVYARKGEMTEAEQQFQAAASWPPYDAYAYNNLGVLRARAGRLDEAAGMFREAVRRMPALTEATDNLARLSRVEGSGAIRGGAGQP